MADSSGGSELERGIALAREGQPEAGYAALRRALFTEGDSATLRLWLATVAPTPAEAIRHLERAQTLAPGDRQVLAALEQARGGSAAASAPPASPEAWVPPAALPLPAGPGGLPAWAVGAPTAPYPGAPVTAPSYGVFEEAQEDMAGPPGMTMLPAVPTAAPRALAPPRPPAPAARPRRRGLLLLLGAVVLLALCTLAGLSLNAGLLSAALTPPAPAPVQLTYTAAAGLAQGATATAARVVQATLTAAPVATALVARREYHDAVTPLLAALRNEDGEIANTVHGADDGVIPAPTASTRLERYVHENTNYQTQAANLDAPVADRPHELQVRTALDLRRQALDFAAQYAQKLRDLADADAVRQDAQRSYNAAAGAYTQATSPAHYVDLLRTKTALDAATSQLDRLRTYADQNHQQFLTAWDQYHATLPEAP